MLKFVVGQPTPPQSTPPLFLRAYETALVALKNAGNENPLFRGGYVRGG